MSDSNSSSAGDKSSEKTAKETPPKSDHSLLIKGVSAVFVTVIAPVLVAAGMKFVDYIGTKPTLSARCKR